MDWLLGCTMTDAETRMLPCITLTDMEMIIVAMYELPGAKLCRYLLGGRLGLWLGIAV